MIFNNHQFTHRYILKCSVVSLETFKSYGYCVGAALYKWIY